MHRLVKHSVIKLIFSTKSLRGFPQFPMGKLESETMHTKSGKGERKVTIIFWFGAVTFGRGYPPQQPLQKVGLYLVPP